jgi:hypothetical protein
MSLFDYLTSQFARLALARKTARRHRIGPGPANTKIAGQVEWKPNALGTQLIQVARNVHYDGAKLRELRAQRGV